MIIILNFHLSSTPNLVNTYLNTLALQISHQIITDSLPTGWDFKTASTCNPINTYFTDVISFESDTSIYLNGHFYPNNISGEGLLKNAIGAKPWDI